MVIVLRLTRRSWPSRLAKRVPGFEFRKQSEITITSKKRFCAVGKADRGNPCIMDNRALHLRTLYKPAQNLKKAVSLSNEMIHR